LVYCQSIAASTKHCSLYRHNIHYKLPLNTEGYLPKINSFNRITKRGCVAKECGLNFRTLVTPVFAAVAASVTAFILLVIFAASEQDAQSLKFEKSVLNQQIFGITNRLAASAMDHAWWNTAVQKVMLDEDPEWIQYSIAETAQDFDHLDGVMIIRPDHSFIFALRTPHDNEPLIDERVFLAAGVGDAIKGLKITPDDENSSTTVGFINLGGRPIAYGASLIRATDETGYTPPLNPQRPAIVFYSTLSDAEFAQLGNNNTIENVTFIDKKPTNAGQLALINAKGASVGWLTWTPREPGTRMALDMISPALVLLALVVVAMIRFVKRANSLVDGLEQANRSKTSFLASMSHEVRTPLNAILGFAELMSLELYGKIEGKKNKEYLKLIKDSGGHLLSVINDILDISKLEAGRFDVYAEKVLPQDIVAECIHMVGPSAKERGVTLTHACENVTLYSDERIMRQILINILSNAIKFTKSGGTVDLIGEQIINQYRITVSDNGIGMSAKEIEIALSTFGQVQNEYTKSHSGTGLGLPLVNRFLTLLDGSFEISSTPGKGTKVTLTFPIKTKAKQL